MTKTQVKLLRKGLREIERIGSVYNIIDRHWKHLSPTEREVARNCSWLFEQHKKTLVSVCVANDMADYGIQQLSLRL